MNVTIENLHSMFQGALPLVREREILSTNCCVGGQVAAFAIDLEQAVLQRHLDSLLSLPHALVELYEHQVFRGFIQDDLTQLQRIRVPERNGEAFCYAHQNPARAARGAGKGRKTAPPGIDIQKTPNPACFLDEWNQKWQQCGLQLSYLVEIDGEDCYCSCNPFPFGDYHCTIATSRHSPQRWSDHADLSHVISSLIELADKLDGWTVLYNGSRSAGASIPAHRHYQTFKVNPAQRPFPLQLAAMVKAKKLRHLNVLPLVGGVDYPITAVRFSGSPDDICRKVVEIAGRWRAQDDSYSENIIAISEDNDIALYYVPRDQFSHAGGFSSAVASLEVMGEFIFSGEQEIRSLAEGDVDYAWLYEVLRAVAPPEAVGLVCHPIAVAA
jgi:ATP adenylyltransferase/5',5'''-P-1,P-4-tetraphosphate phosphorylase II